MAGKKEIAIPTGGSDVTFETEHVLEQMLKAEAAPEPRQSMGDGVINRPNAEVSVPMGFSKTKSAGYVYIYDTVTGEQSRTNNNMLAAQLKKKRPDGSPVFTTVRPSAVLKKPGTLRCMLHPDEPNRSHYDEMGLPVCRKSNLVNSFHVKRHMQKKHRDEWAAIEAELKEQKEKTAEGILTALMNK